MSSEKISKMDIIYANDAEDLLGNKEDLAKIITKLKRRMDPGEKGKELVDETKTFARVKLTTYRHVPVDELKGYDKKFYEFLKSVLVDGPGLSDYMFSDFQINGLKKIKEMISGDDSHRVVILQAPTGSGKTNVFLLPSLWDSIERNSHSILVYPRIALAIDQLFGLIKNIFYAKNSGYRGLSVGILFGGIGSIDEHTFKYNNNLFEKKEIKEQVWVIFKDRKCPICNNGFIMGIYYNKKINDFKCSNKSCGVENLKIYVSKDRILKEKPNIIITTFESLNSISFRPDFEEILRKSSAIVFDEAHIYYQVYGSHLSAFLREFKKENPKLKFVISSATLPNSVNFAKKLTGENNILEIRPSEMDLNKNEETTVPIEEYFLIKSKKVRDRSTSASTLIQLLMLLGHSVNLNGKERLLAFFDSRDNLIRQEKNFKDADGNKKLYNFRLNKEEFLSSEFVEYKCPVGSEKNCNLQYCKASGPYKEGECWFGLTKAIFQNGMKPKTSVLKVDRSMAEDSTYEINKTDIVFTTSSLELGIDDKQISTIVQYRPPYTIFNFIQRKGRAGREQQENTKIYMVLGQDSTDIFYFNNLDRMLDEEYILPLNPDNPYSRWVRNVLDKAKNNFIIELNSGRYVDRDYKDETGALINSFLKNTAENFKIFMKDNTAGRLLDVSYKRKEVGKIIEKQYKSREDEKRRIIDGFSGAESPFDSIRSRVTGLLEVKLDEKINEKLHEFLKNLNSIEVIFKEKNKIERIQLKPLNDIIVDINYYLNPDKNTERILNEILPLIITLEGHNISQDLERLYSLGKEISSLKWLQKIYDVWDSLSIIKYLYNSWFLYTLSIKTEDETANKSSLMDLYPKYIVPENFFGRGESILLSHNDGRLESISIHDLINRYMPHRLPAIVKDDHAYYVSTEYSLKDWHFESDRTVVTVELDGRMERLFYDGNDPKKYYMVPLEIKTRDISMTNDEDNEFNACIRCFYIGDHHERYCPKCGGKLKNSKIFSEPSSKIYLDKKENEENNSFGIHRTTANITYVLKGESVILTFKDEEKEKRWKSEFRFEPNLAKKIENMPVLEFRIKPLESIDLENLKFLEKYRKFTEGEILYSYVHSVSHLYLQTVSFISGVSTEFLKYKIEGNSIYVFEENDTDTGIIDSFIERINIDPTEIMKSLERFSTCRTNQIDIKLGEPNDMVDSGVNHRINNLRLRRISERKAKEVSKDYNCAISKGDGDKLINLADDPDFKHIIQCPDGCPDCLYLNGCEEKEDQGKTISRTLANFYVCSIKKEISKSHFEEKYREKLASLEGFIYEDKDQSVIWVEL